jgi:hypothetical protein
MEDEPKMVQAKTWEEFRASGLLWWINAILHTFGWAIVTEVEANENGEYCNGCTVTKAYPARVRFRGFDEKHNTSGYIKVSKYMKDNAAALDAEARE